jgi:hypothetical protein
MASPRFVAPHPVAVANRDRRRRRRRCCCCRPVLVIGILTTLIVGCVGDNVGGFRRIDSGDAAKVNPNLGQATRPAWWPIGRQRQLTTVRWQLPGSRHAGSISSERTTSGTDLGDDGSSRKSMTVGTDLLESINTIQLSQVGYGKHAIGLMYCVGCKHLGENQLNSFFELTSQNCMLIQRPVF